jgi:hypothetical protein
VAPLAWASAFAAVDARRRDSTNSGRGLSRTVLFALDAVRARTPHLRTAPAFVLAADSGGLVLAVVVVVVEHTPSPAADPPYAAGTPGTRRH